MYFMKRGEGQGWIFVPKSLSWILEDLDTVSRVPIGFGKLGSFCHHCEAVYRKRKMKTLKPHTCKGSSKKPAFFAPGDWGVLWILSCVSIMELLNLQRLIYGDLSHMTLFYVSDTTENIEAKNIRQSNPKNILWGTFSCLGWRQNKRRIDQVELSICGQILNILWKMLSLPSLHWKVSGKTWNKPVSKIGKKCFGFEK